MVHKVTYDANGRVTSQTFPDGRSAGFTYDIDGLLTNVDGLTLARNTSNGLLTGTTLGSVTDSYSYNSFGEVSSYTAAYPAGLSCQIGYTRDAVGRITGKAEDINGITTTWGYTYDLAGRLTQTTKNGDLWANYGYDTNGNRLTKTTSTQTISGTYDAQDRLTAYGNYIYTYTANGELETKTNTANGEVTTYAYDVLGNLRSVVLPDSTLMEYVVDGRNRRVGKKVGGTIERQWIYDGQLRPVAELDGTGALVSQFVYATHINVPDFIIKGATTYRVITDHLGSLRFVIDVSTGTIAQRMDYDDWGNVITNTNADFIPFGFAGGMYDSQTKLVRFGARDYDAETGRWTAKDPIGFGGGSANMYAYIDNDPLNQIDVTGLGSVGSFLRQFNRLCAGMLGRYLDYNLSALSKDIYNPLRSKGPCGTTLLRVPKMLSNFGRQGITLGDYIFIDADAPDSVTQHELGHVAQFDEYGPNLYGLYAGSYVFTYIQQQIFGMKVDPAVDSYFERTADKMKPKDCECEK